MWFCLILMSVTINSAGYRIFFYSKQLNIKLYLRIHDEHHWCTSVDFSCNHLVCNRISSMKVQFNKLPVAIGSIHDAPINALISNETIHQWNKYKSVIALTLKLSLLWLSNCKLLILGCFFMWCKLFILCMFVV